MSYKQDKAEIEKKLYLAKEEVQANRTILDTMDGDSHTIYHNDGGTTTWPREHYEAGLRLAQEEVKLVQERLDWMNTLTATEYNEVNGWTDFMARSVKNKRER